MKTLPKKIWEGVQKVVSLLCHLQEIVKVESFLCDLQEMMKALQKCSKGVSAAACLDCKVLQGFTQSRMSSLWFVSNNEGAVCNFEIHTGCATNCRSNIHWASSTKHSQLCEPYKNVMMVDESQVQNRSTFACKVHSKMISPQRSDIQDLWRNDFAKHTKNWCFAKSHQSSSNRAPSLKTLWGRWALAVHSCAKEFHYFVLLNLKSIALNTEARLRRWWRHETKS